MQESLSIVFVGHVDNGKSTTCGHLLMLLGLVEAREFEKVTNEAIIQGMESWKYAYLMDSDTRERETGKTMDAVSTVIDISSYQGPIQWLKSYTKKLIFIDTPGHKQLVKYMIEGAYKADVALLFCSVKKGEFESGMSGQTKEHLYLLRGLGVKQLVVVFNKMDTIQWNKEEFDDIQKRLLTFVKKIKFPTVKTVAISGWDGTNLVEDYNAHIWGPNLLKVILEATPREPEPLIAVASFPYIRCQFMFLDENYNGVVSAGFQAVLHNANLYFDAEIESIENKVFVKKGENARMVLRLKTQACVTTMMKNVVLRNEDVTIAIGVVLC